MKRILIREGSEIPQEYKDYEVHILSNTSLYKDGPDNLKFGNIRDLHKKYNYDLLLTGDDPVLELFLASGRKNIYKNAKVIDSKEITSYEEAIEFDKTKKSMKFLEVLTVYRYEERPGALPTQDGSRKFCRELMNSDLVYTITDINNMNNGQINDVFTSGGGFYNVPGSSEIRPFCRHYWKAEIIVIP